MPLLRVSIDGTIVVAMPSEGYNIMGARIGGTRDDDVHAGLSIWGGVYGHGDRDSHCIWLDDHPLKVGQVVQFEFVPFGPQIGSGKPFDSTGIKGPPADYSFEEEVRGLAEELTDRPWIRGAFRFSYTSSLLAPVAVWTDPSEYGFGFHALWNDVNPAYLSASLYAYTIEGLARQENGRNLTRERIALGQTCQLELVA